ncbi:MAG: nucleoside triphosphate pyrophosphatase [Candidatus Omnitrophota bacterium]|nr:septum formation protein Maf [Candidatus Omnitrophota bacterium]
MEKIILASASERRSRILAECGISHEVIRTGVKEISGGNMYIADIVCANAERKAETVTSDGGSIIIGADTLVLNRGEIIGKPADETEARAVLGRLSGSEAEVYTGLCVIKDGKRAVDFEKSSLKIVALNEEEIEKIFDLLGPYDKAGGFSIEGVGSLIFDNIEGSYFNILGLPMIKLGELFKKLGSDLLDHCKPEAPST